MIKWALCLLISTVAWAEDQSIHIQEVADQQIADAENAHPPQAVQVPEVTGSPEVMDAANDISVETQKAEASAASAAAEQEPAPATVKTEPRKVETRGRNDVVKPSEEVQSFNPPPPEVIKDKSSGGRKYSKFRLKKKHDKHKRALASVHSHKKSKKHHKHIAKKAKKRHHHYASN